jgi:hypothetical protein
MSSSMAAPAFPCPGIPACTAPLVSETLPKAPTPPANEPRPVSPASPPPADGHGFTHSQQFIW